MATTRPIRDLLRRLAAVQAQAAVLTQVLKDAGVDDVHVPAALPARKPRRRRVKVVDLRRVVFMPDD
jgi:hypothetical protein